MRQAPTVRNEPNPSCKEIQGFAGAGLLKTYAGAVLVFAGTTPDCTTRRHVSGSPRTVDTWILHLDRHSRPAAQRLLSCLFTTIPNLQRSKGT